MWRRQPPGARGRLKGRPYAFEITATAFDAMNWITEHLGAEAILSVGDLVRAHVHNAIQHLSEPVPVRSVFAHTGWRRVVGDAVFLHGGGGLGAHGPIEGAETRLEGGLARYVLPEPPEGDELREAVRASLALLDVAPDHVTTALLAMVYRAPLGQVDFCGFLVGPSGAGKSELAALAQQHYGAGMDRLHLPASWSSTGNALEGTAFQAKDVLLIIDDFAPTVTVSDLQRLHREAERLLRAAGNASARQRMRADTTIRQPKPPRGLLLGTGEDVPRGHSLRSRLVVIEVGPTDVDWTRLSALQDLAARGTLAAAMAGYLRWLAPSYDDEAGRVRARFQDLRDAAAGSASHRRTPEAIANLAIGFERFLQFAEHVGAIDADSGTGSGSGHGARSATSARRRASTSWRPSRPGASSACFRPPSRPAKPTWPRHPASRRQTPSRGAGALGRSGTASTTPAAGSPRAGASAGSTARPLPGAGGVLRRLPAPRPGDRRTADHQPADAGEAAARARAAGVRRARPLPGEAGR